MATSKDSLKDMLSQMEAFVSSKTVIGDPIKLDDMTILPLVDVSLGLGASSREKEKAGSVGGGIGAKMSPSAVLVVKDGKVRLVSLKNQDNISKALDLLPDLIDRFTGKNAEDDAKIKAKMEELEENKD